MSASPAGAPGSMDECYSGKHIFITGATGFVGKVFVEKILRSLPTVERVYLLVRPGKGGQTPQERLEKELRNSACFDTLRAALGKDFDGMFREKVVAVGGTLTEEQMGIAEADYRTLCEKTNMIFHLAATIDFDERLDRSVQLNVLGALRVLALARRCHARGGFDGMVHVSTCYVGYPQSGTVEERVYPIGCDAELMTQHILNWTPEEMPKRTEAILKEFRFANTYTFTKSLAERLLCKQAGGVPLAIARPSIIGASHREPVPGWVDTLSASGALFLTSGLGVVREVHVDTKAYADIIPVDYVVNGLLLVGHRTARLVAAQASKAETAARPASAQMPLTALNLSKQQRAAVASPAARPQQGDDAASVGTRLSTLERGGAAAVRDVPVYHLGTSGTSNPVTWGTVCMSVVRHYQREKPANAFRPCDVCLTGSRVRYETRFHMRRTLPAAGIWAYSRTAGALQQPEKKKDVQKQADRLRKATEKAYYLVQQFRKFTTKGWTFSTASRASLFDGLSDEEQAAWTLDPQDITWHVYVARYCYGIHKFVLKQKGAKMPYEHHASGSSQLLRANL
eukprot:TRINITY_DN30762_c0_g1_i1.p2 TRINITY_DN30762_c0_g1~~TRINITY_DN30762_c0_g1_i1.p2  ORF type:complete len:569 (+),score=201.29 TRINITY_DN30762_c0_g1_i1:84-1790(+)